MSPAKKTAKPAAKKPAEASVPSSLYPQESLVAAAHALGERAAVGLGEDGKRWLLEVTPGPAAAGADAEALLGELLNEALSHARRQERLRENRAEAAAVVARLLEKGFPGGRADPLEELEPQVRLDRAEEAKKLLAAAKGLA